MLDHASITVPDLVAAERFYDAVMGALGVPKVGADHEEGWVGYGLRCDRDHPHRSYLSLRSGPAPEVASGRHWCFKAAARSVVEAFWQAGIAHGGQDAGAPGLRSTYHAHYFAAFLLDPAGNRVEAVCHNESDATELQDLA